MRLTELVKEEVENATYLKLVRNKAHMGPVSEEKIALAKASALSAAANKVRVTAGFTVKVNTDDQKSESKTNSPNQSWRITELGDDTPGITAKYAVLLMQAWDNVYTGDGTQRYVEKLAQALQARANAYTQLGINPTAGSKPNLTSDQRLVYNSVVGPTGFDYYEYHLAFKIDGQKKFIRSRTYRSIKPLDLDQIIRKLTNEMTLLNSKITITSRKTN